jgi:hypothetical protein
MEDHLRRDEITVTWSEQRFSPVSYNSFGIGPFYMRTAIGEDETPEGAAARALAHLRKVAEEVYQHERQEFVRRLRGARESAE